MRGGNRFWCSWVLCGVMLLGGDAAARSRVREVEVLACSQFGHGCVKGVVRPGTNGAEVRMPGGTWIGCKLDCRNTLREETIDFWETRERDKPFVGIGRRR